MIVSNYNKICGGYFSGKITQGTHSDAKSFVFSVTSKEVLKVIKPENVIKITNSNCIEFGNELRITNVATN